MSRTATRGTSCQYPWPDPVIYWERDHHYPRRCHRSHLPLPLDLTAPTDRWTSSASSIATPITEHSAIMERQIIWHNRFFSESLPLCKLVFGQEGNPSPLPIPPIYRSLDRYHHCITIVGHCPFTIFDPLLLVVRGASTGYCGRRHHSLSLSLMDSSRAAIIATKEVAAVGTSSPPRCHCCFSTSRRVIGFSSGRDRKEAVSLWQKPTIEVLWFLSATERLILSRFCSEGRKCRRRPQSSETYSLTVELLTVTTAGRRPPPLPWSLPWDSKCRDFSALDCHFTEQRWHTTGWLLWKVAVGDHHFLLLDSVDLRFGLCILIRLQDIKLYTFYMELDLQKPYPTRGSDLLTWEFTNLKYSRVEIDEVQFEWAECMLDYI
ncbi:hypothetical protein ZIOFF_060239 [Zingiber officinale]|uniref:Uncharacterized protein n=1 Tax=Zingiber officinale TaxID=94328 RepID=A0A8J5FEC8_ZINOF|nr:hypothetical protein ZIOFF_060239 [Zingiber officinale]